MRYGRLWLAFGLAPFLPALVVAAWLHDWSASVIAIAFAVPFSYAPCFVLGLPLINALTRYHRLTLGYLVLCGGFFGIGVFHLFLFVLSRMLSSSMGSSIGVGPFVAGAGLGSLVALAFGLIAGVPWRTPRSSRLDHAAGEMDC